MCKWKLLNDIIINLSLLISWWLSPFMIISFFRALTPVIGLEWTYKWLSRVNPCPPSSATETCLHNQHMLSFNCLIVFLLGVSFCTCTTSVEPRPVFHKILALDVKKQHKSNHNFSPQGSKIHLVCEQPLLRYILQSYFSPLYIPLSVNTDKAFCILCKGNNLKGSNSATVVIVQCLKVAVQTQGKFFFITEKLTLSWSSKVFLRWKGYIDATREKLQMDKHCSGCRQLRDCHLGRKTEDGWCWLRQGTEGNSSK